MLGGSSGQLDIRARGLEDERIVSFYLENSVHRNRSWRAEERGIKTTGFSTGIAGNLATIENRR